MICDFQEGFFSLGAWGVCFLQACCKQFKTFIQVTLAEVACDTEIRFLELNLGNLSSPSIIANCFGKQLNVCSHIFKFGFVSLFSPVALLSVFYSSSHVNLMRVKFP